MDRDLPDIEELFRSALEDEEEMPEPKVWKAIDQVLDKENVNSLKKKYEDLKKIAFLLFFMLTGLSIYELEKPNRNNTFLNKDIVSEKSKGANSKDESNGGNRTVNKITAPGSFDNNETKKVSKHLSILENMRPNTDPTERSSASPDDKKQARDYRIANFDHRLFPASQVATNNPAIYENEISKVQKEKYSRPDAVSSELNHINLDSVNTIILPPTLSPIKVISGMDKQESAVKGVKNKNNKSSALSVNFFFSPDFASYRLRDNVSGNNGNEAAEIEKNERHEFSSTIGALIDYKANKHWSIQSGLTFSNTNINVAPKTIYAQPDNTGSIKYLLNTSSGYGYVLPSFSHNPTIGDSLYAFTSTHTLQYLSLPVAIKHNITRGKFNFYAMAGTAVNLLIRGKIETSVEDGTNNEPEVVDNLQGLKKIYFSGLTGVGIDYLLNNKIAVTFAPTYRYALNSINKNASVKSYPKSIGLSTGVKFRF